MLSMTRQRVDWRGQRDRDSRENRVRGRRFDCGHKAVALPVHCPDDRRVRTFRLHGLTDFGQTARERCFADKRPGPASVKQFVFSDHPVAMLQQVQEHLEPLRFKRYFLSGVSQLIEADIKGVAIKGINHDRTFINIRGATVL
jgi:hypothetical protein